MKTSLRTWVMTLASVAGCVLLGTSLRAQVCTLNSGPDLIVGELTSVANYPSAGGYEALALGTVACNLGDVNLAWVAGNPQHPVMGTNLYRLKDRGNYLTFEQVGRSWLMHGFFALSQIDCCTNCTATGGSALGTGCSSPNSASSNGSQANLGPHWEVDANQGTIAYPPANPPFSGPTARRLEVAIADLETIATTRYYAEGHFVAADDELAGNGDNNASYRELSVSGSGTSWNFNLTGSTVREAPAIEAWVDSGRDPNVQLQSFDLPGEGHLVLGCSVTELAGGFWHYEYALYNMNSDDSIRRFSVPIGTGTVVTDVEFHSVPYRWGDGPGSVDFDNTPWSVTVSGGSIHFEVVGNYNPPADISHNALRWGSTMNFRFNADSGPVPADVALETYKTETQHAVSGAKGPAGTGGISFCDDADGSLASCPCANPGSVDTGCDIQQATGGVGLIAVAQETSPQNRVTWSGTGFPAMSTPAAIVIRAADLDTAAPIVFGDGLRCVGTPIVRLGAAFAFGGGSTHTHGHGAGPGAGTFFYQLWFRNQPPMFCDPVAAFNLSNGRRLVW